MFASWSPPACRPGGRRAEDFCVGHLGCIDPAGVCDKAIENPEAAAGIARRAYSWGVEAPFH